MSNQYTTFATKIPRALKKNLDALCKEAGLRKTFVIETALRDKIEELLDLYDLNDAIEDATGFHSWSNIKRELNLK